MNTAERTFNILELCCFPKGCRIAQETQTMLATVLVPQLEAAGMTTAEWTRGALMLEEPHYSRVKDIVCRGCKHFECEHNPNQGRQAGNLFDELLNCGYGERTEMNAKLLEALLPAASIAQWAAQGVEIIMYPMSSRTRFSVGAYIKHPTKGEVRLSVSRKKGEAGEITVSGADYTKHPMPRTPGETSLKLRELINAMV